MKEYCLCVEKNDNSGILTITKKFIEELADIIKILNFEEISSIKIFRSDILK